MNFQARLTTRMPELAEVGEALLELRSTLDRHQLDPIVKAIIRDSRVQVDGIESRTLDFILGGKFLQTTIDKHLELYELDAKQVLNEKLVDIEYLFASEPPKPLLDIPHDDWVSAVEANDSYIITGSYDNSLRIFSAKTNKNLVTIDNAHEKPICDIKILNHQENHGKKRSSGDTNTKQLYFVSCGHDETALMQRFNVDTNRCEQLILFKGHNRSVNCMDSYDDLLATGAFDKSVRVWSTNLDELNQTDESQPDKKGKKQRVDAAAKLTRKPILTFTGHQESVTGLSWPQERELVSCSLDGTIRMWDIEEGECKRTIPSGRPMLAVDSSKETNNILLTASCDRYIRLWDLRTPDTNSSTTFTSHNGWVSCVTFTTKQRGKEMNFVSGGYDNLVKYWDIRSPKACLFDLIGHHDKVLDIACGHPELVLSGSADSTLKLYSNK